MIPGDLLTRLSRAHNNAVKAAQRWTASTPGTQTQKKLFTIYENSERKFEDALSAVIDIAANE